MLTPGGSVLSCAARAALTDELLALPRPHQTAAICPAMKSMSKRELIDRELDRLPDQDLDRLLAFVQSLKEAHADATMPALVAESALAKDWLTPEEDAAWANL
jgi:hypothetical protein